MKSTDTIAAKLADYKTRLSKEGLDDNDVTTVLVSVLGDVVTAQEENHNQLKRAKYAVLGLAAGLVVATIAFTTAIISIGKTTSAAELEAAKQQAALISRLEAASQRTESAADLCNASAHFFVKTLEDMGSIATALNSSLRSAEETARRTATNASEKSQPLPAEHKP
jgi:hypothetical protein